MNTQSHFLINYTLAKLLRLPKRYSVRMSSIVWGSLAPDIMLYVLSLGAVAYYRSFHGWTVERAFDHAFDTLFFQNPWWIALHNFFQAPLILFALIAIGLLIMRSAKKDPDRQSRKYTIGLWILAFSLSALLHSILDIVTHHDDGPFLLFPFDTTIRFISPISYWDPDHHGLAFTIFEWALDLVCVGYLIYLRVIHVKAKRASITKKLSDEQ